VDALSGCAISRFVSHKSDLEKGGLELLNDLHTKGITVSSIRCDNAPENKQLETGCKRDKMGIQFEYTAPGTPQQDGISERKFATLFGRVRTMNTVAGLQSDLRHQLWVEAANGATDLDCILLRKMGDLTPDMLFYGKPAPYAPFIRTFGEMGVIRDI
jgi:hypothetical protein